MHTRSVSNAAEAREIVEQRGLQHVKVGVFDIDGVLRGKYMSKDKFFSALARGFGFCDVVLGWDVKDQLYDNTQFTGWHSGYPDAPVNIIPSTCRDLPFEERGLFFLGEFAAPADQICPRSLLKRVIADARASGLVADCGFEYELFVFNESPASVREKQYQGLTPLAPDEFGYSIIRNSVESDIYQQLLKLGETMDFGLEGLHEETGPGVLEAAITHGEALQSADKAALFKTFTKVALQKQNKMATFMARWSEHYPGQSGHIHLSLTNPEGEPLFFDDAKPDNISDLMRHFLAGQQQLMPELLAMIAPTINSYRRLIPGFWAPTEASIGIDNRTCAIRVISGDKNSQRIEYRIAAADANPYIILAAAIASGLWGVRNKAEPAEFVTGNAYQQSFPATQKLAANLWDAAQRLKTSTMARQYFGDAFVDHFAATREWEVREFRKHISQWELQRYFEII